MSGTRLSHADLVLLRLPESQGDHEVERRKAHAVLDGGNIYSALLPFSL